MASFEMTDVERNQPKESICTNADVLSTSETFVASKIVAKFINTLSSIKCQGFVAVFFPWYILIQY
jgi:hypothetical protein